MTKAIENLERAALDAHGKNRTWDTFWARHGADVRQAEPWDRQRFRRLVSRLLHLLTTGDPAGQFGVGDPDAPNPWEEDDQQAAAEARLSQVTLECGQLSVTGPPVSSVFLGLFLFAVNTGNLLPADLVVPPTVGISKVQAEDVWLAGTVDPPPADRPQLAHRTFRSTKEVQAATAQAASQRQASNKISRRGAAFVQSACVLPTHVSRLPIPANSWPDHPAAESGMRLGATGTMRFGAGPRGHKSRPGSDYGSWPMIGTNSGPMDESSLKVGCLSVDYQQLVVCGLAIVELVVKQFRAVGDLDTAGGRPGVLRFLQRQISLEMSGPQRKHQVVRVRTVAEAWGRGGGFEQISDPTKSAGTQNEGPANPASLRRPFAPRLGQEGRE